MSQGDTLPGVPWVESPLFERLFADADAETLRVARALHTDGLALIDFPEPEIGALAEAVIAALGPRMPLDAFRAGHAGGPRTEGAWREVPAVRQIAGNAAVIALLGRLYGRRAFPFQTLNFPVGTQQHPHTDSVHFNSMPERFLCGVWVALEDIHSEAGPLMYYPGSHRLPVFTNEHIGFSSHRARAVPNQTTYEPMWRDLVEVLGLKPAQFLPKRGQAVIWAANLLHGGSAQADLNRTRWSQVTHYYFEDCAYYTPLHSDPPFGKIAFREIEDIATGQPVPSRYLGQPVPDAYLAATRQDAVWAGGPTAGLAEHAQQAGAAGGTAVRQARQLLRKLGGF